MADKVEYDPKSLFIPVPRPNREDLRNIPIGAPMLVVNLTPEGVGFEGADWNAADQAEWIALLPDEEARFESTSIFYVSPDRLRKDEGPVRDVEDIVTEAIAQGIPTGNPDIDAEDLVRIAVGMAREGMVTNPF